MSVFGLIVGAMACVAYLAGLVVLSRIALRTREIGFEIWELKRRESVEQIGRLFVVCGIVFALSPLLLVGLVAYHEHGSRSLASENQELQVALSELDTRRLELVSRSDRLTQTIEDVEQRVKQASQDLIRANARYRKLRDNMSFEVRRGPGTALVRSSPTGDVVEAVDRGLQVKIRQEKPRRTADRIWLPIKTPTGTDGWMAADLVSINPELVTLLAEG